MVVQPIGKNISQLGSLPQTSKECKENAMQKNLRIQGIINLVTHNVIFEGNSLALDLYKKGNDSLEVVPPKNIIWPTKPIKRLNGPGVLRALENPTLQNEEKSTLRTENLSPWHCRDYHSKWPFYPLVEVHLPFPKGHLTIPPKGHKELPGIALYLMPQILEYKSNALS